MNKVVPVLVLLALMLVWSPSRILAHGQPAIQVTPDIVAAGGTITVKGTTMGAGEEFKISLEGLKFRADLGSAQSDANETLTVQFIIPGNAPAGDYQIKALSTDGDATTADLTVTAAANETPTPAPGEAAEPSAAAHQVPRSRTPGETIGLFALVVLSAAIGLVLVRRK